MITAELCFAEKLNLLRKRKELTQEDLALKLGISTGYLGMICAGYVDPERIPDKLKVGIARNLGVSKKELFEDMNAAYARYRRILKAAEKGFKPVRDMIKEANLKLKRLGLENRMY